MLTCFPLCSSSSSCWGSCSSVSPRPSQACDPHGRICCWFGARSAPQTAAHCVYTLFQVLGRFVLFHSRCEVGLESLQQGRIMR